MVNMGYCRFRNTEMALDECLTAIENGRKLNGEEMEEFLGNVER